jgi:cell division protein FtsI/penicillin-binding protein 2
VAVTPIQLMSVYATMENGGYAITPHVADMTTAASATAAKVAPRQVITPSLSASLTGLMEHVVTAVPSYDQATYIPHYYVGGKTGTAQIWDQSLNRGAGGWMENIYNYSFYGWVGTDSPDLNVGVIIYQGTPTKVGQGILNMPIQSTQLFRRIAHDAVTTEKLPPNKNGPQSPGTKKTKSLG